MSNGKKPATPPDKGTKDGGNQRTGTGNGHTQDSGKDIRANVPTNSGGPRKPDGGKKK